MSIILSMMTSTAMGMFDIKGKQTECFISDLGLQLCYDTVTVGVRVEESIVEV